MNRKILLAASCVISLATGYLIRGGTSTSAEETRTSAAPSRPDRPSATKTRTRHTGDNALLDSILGGRPISEIFPSDLAVLIARLSKHEPDMDPLVSAKQRYQLQLLLAKLSPSDLTNIADTIASDAGHQGNGAISSIISALAGKDPDRALEWVSTRENSGSLLSLVIGTIARDDPHRAAAMFQKSFLDGTFSHHDFWNATSGIGTAMAKLGAVPLLKFIDSLPESQQINMMSNAIRSVPDSERINLLNELQLRSSKDELRQYAINQVFSDAFSSDAEGAREWFAKFPEGPEKDNLRINTTVSLITGREKETATGWLREALAASPGKEKHILQNVISNLAYRNHGDLAHYAALLPQDVEFTATELEGTAITSLRAGTGGLIAIASVIRDPAEQSRLIAGTLDKVSARNSPYTRVNSTDLEILSRKVATMGLTGENAALVNAAIEAAKNPKTPDTE